MSCVVLREHKRYPQDANRNHDWNNNNIQSSSLSSCQLQSLTAERKGTKKPNKDFQHHISKVRVVNEAKQMLVDRFFLPILVVSCVTSFHVASIVSARGPDDTKPVSGIFETRTSDFEAPPKWVSARRSRLPPSTTCHFGNCNFFLFPIVVKATWERIKTRESRCP